MTKKKVFYWLGIVLLCLGLFDMGDAFVGGGRMGAGKLFYDGDRAGELVARAIPYGQVLAAACDDEALAERFDSASVKKFDKWCKAVRAFAERPNPERALGLLRAGNLYFERVTEKLYASGGDVAQRSVELMEANCELKPLLEQVGSISASAAFSEFLIGLILAIVGLVLYLRGRRPA
jgi:hypothetical protein